MMAVAAIIPMTLPQPNPLTDANGEGESNGAKATPMVWLTPTTPAPTTPPATNP